jgi:hypothetical protein
MYLPPAVARHSHGLRKHYVDHRAGHGVRAGRMTRQSDRPDDGRSRGEPARGLSLAVGKCQLHDRRGLGPVRHHRPRLVATRSARRLRVGLRASDLSCVRRVGSIDVRRRHRLRARMRFCRTASRSLPGCCDARVPSRASHAAMSGLTMASRFHGRHISCSDLVRNGGWAACGQICAATLKWTIVVLRDGRRCRFVARGCSAVGSASPCQGEGRGFESRHPLEGAVASTPAVEWPSGEATACKAVHTGSIPVSTSK